MRPGCRFVVVTPAKGRTVWLTSQMSESDAVALAAALRQTFQTVPFHVVYIGEEKTRLDEYLLSLARVLKEL